MCTGYVRLWNSITNVPLLCEKVKNTNLNPGISNSNPRVTNLIAQMKVWYSETCQK